jgi:hypothetical protein
MVMAEGIQTTSSKQHEPRCYRLPINQSSAAARIRRCKASISELTYSQPLTTTHTELKVRDEGTYPSSRHLGMTLACEEGS